MKESGVPGVKRVGTGEEAFARERRPGDLRHTGVDEAIPFPLPLHT